MNELLRRADETPVTLVVLIAYATMAVLTDPFHPSMPQLLQWGALTGVDVWDGEPWRLVSHAFLHGGILHLGVNTLSLISLAPLLERSVGSLKFALIYLVTAVGGGMAGVSVLDPRAPLVGGSGALFGMLGALLALVARSGRHTGDFFGNHVARTLLGNIGLNLLLGFALPNVSNAAHIGGAITGFLFVFFVLERGRRANPRTIWLGRATVAAWFAGALLATLCPVTRWDWLCLQWERSAPGARRDALRQAFGHCSPPIVGLDHAIEPSDGDMRQFVEQFERERRSLREH